MENSSQEIELTKDEYEFELRKKNSHIENYKNCLELIQQQYYETKDELTENKKELEAKNIENKLLKSKNVQLKNEINSLNAKIADLKVELTDAKHLIENEKKNVQLILKPANNVELLNEQFRSEINEWKQKSFLLKLDYEKALSYVSDYVNKLKTFEDNLKQVLSERNEFSESLNRTLVQVEELKKQNAELIATSANKQIQLNRVSNNQKQEQVKKQELCKKLRESNMELNKIKVRCKQLEDELNQFSNENKRKSLEKNQSNSTDLCTKTEKVLKLMEGL